MMEKNDTLGSSVRRERVFQVLFSRVQEHECLLGHGSADSRGRICFSLSEMYTEPSYWNWFGVIILEIDPRKYVIVNMVCGLTPTDWR